MPRFKSINFYEISLKLSYFCKKKLKFLSAGGSASRPQMASGGWGRSSRTPETAPPIITDFWLRAVY